MILYYFPIAQNAVNKTVSDCCSEMYILVYEIIIMNVHIFYYFSIYWSDTSLRVMCYSLSLITVLNNKI